MSLNRTIIDREISRTGLGRPYASITDVFKGYDHRQAGSPFIKDTTTSGYSFFTRPLLNLSYDNIGNDDLLSTLLDPNPRSPYAYIRAALDPQGMHKCDFFDNTQAFIPLLHNTCKNHSGWPDKVLDTYTSPEGKRNESWGMVDGPAEYNRAFDLTTSFAGMEGNVLIHMMDCWATYSGLVYMGEITPYPEAIDNNYIDYQSRQWRLTLDRNKKHVVDIGTAFATYPAAVPLGGRFNYSRDSPYLTDTDTVDLQWRCHGVEYNTPFLIQEFNMTVGIFQKLGGGVSGLSKITNQEINMFNFSNSYPYIDPKTRELSWYVSGEERQLVQARFEL